jgi:hypothetical protein
MAEESNNPESAAPRPQDIGFDEEDINFKVVGQFIDYKMEPVEECNE